MTPEIEERGTEVIFHHLHESAGIGRKKVRIAAAPRFAERDAPGSLRDVAGYEACELGAIAALEDECLFQTGG